MMAGDKSNPSSEDSSKNHHIPPPTDPYVTYQSPYPRNPSEEIHNPFIEFRRLADAAFSSFFSGLPRFLGTEKFKEANIKESDQAFVEAFDQQAKEFESRIAEMVRAKAQEAEGFRKQLEQEWEEKRRENEKRMEEENQRWEMMRRGLERCPGLRPDDLEPKQKSESELDLYDGLKAYEAPAYKSSAGAGASDTKTCPWRDARSDEKWSWNDQEKNSSSWLSGLGFDGRRRAKNIPLSTNTDGNTRPMQEKNVEWQEYRDEEMDPFTDDDHVVPWLRLSPYSPLNLIHDSAQDQAWELGEMPWDEAFEDLMSVHKTGRLPSLIRRLVYWGGPNQWMTDMALRGNLGPRWEEGSMVAALIGAVDGCRWRGFDALKEQCLELTGHEFNKGTTWPHESMNQNDGCYGYEGEVSDGEDQWPVRVDPGEKRLTTKQLRMLHEARQAAVERQDALLEQRHSHQTTFGAQGMLWPSPEEVLSALVGDKDGREYMDGFKDELLARDKVAAPSSQESLASSSVPMKSQICTDDNRLEGVVSTLTTTTTRTLSDGSVETRWVLKRRFANGSEENSESTEVRPMQPAKLHDASTQTIVEETSKKTDGSHKPGWFWN